jgi:tetratricopeptide (TPR) repeat protein
MNGSFSTIAGRISILSSFFVLFGAVNVSSAYSQSNSMSEQRQAAKASIEKGESAFTHRNWKEAEQHFLNALRQDPKNVIALYDLGLVYARQNKLNQAARVERKAIQINEAFVPAYIELSWILAEQGKLAEAELAAIKAVELEPTNDSAKRNLQIIKDRKVIDVEEQKEDKTRSQSELAHVDRHSILV